MRLLLIAFLISAVLLLALGVYVMDTVPKAGYVAIRSEKEKCEMELVGAIASSTAASARIGSLETQAAECSASKSSIDKLYKQSILENTRLRADLDVMSKAKEKAAEIAKYELLKAYYLDAFGPDAVPNTVKLDRISKQAGKLGDTELVAIWSQILDCNSLYDCDLAKKKYVARLDSDIAGLSAELVTIVRSSSQ